MAIYILYNPSYVPVGKYDSSIGKYMVVKSLELGQILVAPRFQKANLGSVGISHDIIQKLIRLKCKTIKFTITGYKRTFDAYVDMDKFLERAIPFHARGKKLGDKQLIMYLANMRLVDYNQEKLEKNVEVK